MIKTIVSDNVQISDRKWLAKTNCKNVCHIHAVKTLTIDLYWYSVFQTWGISVYIHSSSVGCVFLPLNTTECL